MISRLRGIVVLLALFSTFLGLGLARAQTSEKDSASSPLLAESSQPAPATPTVEVTQPAKPAEMPVQAAAVPSPIMPLLNVGAVKSGKPVRVYVIPVREEIGEPVLYIIRRGLKQAINEKADVVILDMNTPGGALSTTFEILEGLSKFEGLTMTYVNTEAISAGALISAGTHEIWFAPRALIGAAAPVLSGGKDVEATMKQKIVSYLKARVRALSQGRGTYRGQVVSAMIDADYELKIGDKIIKPKGELLSLTDTEALEVYGEPPQKLLGEGIAKSIEALLDTKYGKDGYTLTKLETNWSEQLAVWLTAIAPILLGLGVLALFIEFKTPGFGIFGITGITLLAIVFLSNYSAGLSGHEPLILFAVGLLLVFLELFFFPGVAVVAVLGLFLMFGALVWSMADLWPNEPFTLSGDIFVRPLINLGLGLGLALVLGLLFARFLPHGWVWDRMIIHATVGSSAQSSGLAPDLEGGIANLIGATGIAVSALRPSGQVEIGGRRYEARVEVGMIDSGVPVVVRGRSDFGLIVEKV